MKLEKQVALFDKIFNDKQFKKKYNNLKSKDKKLLDKSIFSIHKRIEKCYSQVEEFMKKLPENLIGEGKR